MDFRKLNKASLKDNYSLPKMDHILQNVVVYARISMMHGFSRYNQVAVHPHDHKKNYFTTPWGNFMYTRMSFDLINVVETFQREMEITFVGEKDKFVVVYLDDINVFSKIDEDHIQHLKRTLINAENIGCL